MTPDEAYRACREAVRREASRWPELGRRDAEQDLWVAVLSALPKYDPSRGAVDRWVEGVARKALRRAADENGRLVRRPSYWCEAARRAARADAAALSLHGRLATDGELETAGTRRYSVRETDRAPVSLDEPACQGRPRGWTRHDITAAPTQTPEERAALAEDEAALHTALAQLGPRHRQVVVLAWGLDGDGPKVPSEIASLLALEIGAVRGMLAEAEAALPYLLRY